MSGTNRPETYNDPKHADDLTNHSTVQPPKRAEVPFAHEDFYVDEQLRPLQNITGNGPVRKVELNQLPGPARLVGYFLKYVLPVLFLIIIVISWLK